MDNNFLGVIIFFTVINLVAFLTMMLDKSKSKNSATERISEGMLFFIATAFGSVGVYAGMFAFRHKTRKWYFVIGIPLVIMQNIVFLWVIYDFLNSL